MCLLCYLRGGSVEVTFSHPFVCLLREQLKTVLVNFHEILRLSGCRKFTPPLAAAGLRVELNHCACLRLYWYNDEYL